MRRRWKKFRYRLEWAGLHAAAKLVPLLSRKACFRLAHSLGFIMSIFDRHGRKVALSNLDVAFGDYIEFENLEEIDRATGPERNFITACYHYSNFEWFSLASGYSGLTGTIITQEFKNSLLDPIFKKIREQSGHEMIPRERGIIRLYKVLRRKGRTALLVDLTVPPTQGAVVIDCFGLKTSVTSAHAWLHERTGVPIIPAHCEPLPDGRYRVVFHPEIERTAEMTHQQIAQACWNSFEPYVRKNPAPWLWMYKHWRYLPANAARPYPFYAHLMGPFDQIVRRDERRAKNKPAKQPKTCGEQSR